MITKLVSGEHKLDNYLRKVSMVNVVDASGENLDEQTTTIGTEYELDDLPMFEVTTRPTTVTHSQLVQLGMNVLMHAKMWLINFYHFLVHYCGDDKIQLAFTGKIFH